MGSAIEWTDETWNPVTGCSKVSPGCAHCYAEALTMRHHKAWGVPGLPWTPQNAAENVVLKPERLSQPLSWRKPRMIFVNSMSDLFHEEIPNDYIAQVFGVMAQCPQHTFQVLTKRPERMRDKILVHWGGWEPPPNIWWGTSIENHRWTGRADVLRDTPAAVRFISAEPLLGPLLPSLIDFGGHRHSHRYDCEEKGCDLEALWAMGERLMCDEHARAAALDLTGIHWLIVGGESGARHRPIKPEWVRDLRDACLAQTRGDGDWDVAPDGSGISHASLRPRTAFFFKQWGGRTPKANGRELYGRTWDEMPVRELIF